MRIPGLYVETDWTQFNLPHIIMLSSHLTPSNLTYANDIIIEPGDSGSLLFSADLRLCDFSKEILCSDESCLIYVVSVVAVASSEESPVAMKLKKMWLKAPVSEDGDTNLGKC
jgi:hypothetical protein